MSNTPATPSPLLHDYREHSSAVLEPAELQRVFSGSPTFLRRLANFALTTQASVSPATNNSRNGAHAAEGAAHGR